METKWKFSRLETLKRQKETQEDRDIDWSEVAQEANIGITTLYRYRRDEVQQPQLHVVMALCKYFGVPVEFFEDKEDEEGNQQGHQEIPSGPIAMSVAPVG
jgi:transcriptional regulator with XRE-family HTH domain